MLMLYYSAGSCSTSCHIALEECGIEYQAIRLDWDHPDANLEKLKKLNPLEVTPVLELDSGNVLTQNAAILEYLADQKPESRLLPPTGTWERAEALSWLTFVSSDLHKSFSPLFALRSMVSDEAAQGEIRNWAIQGVKKYLSHVDARLNGRDFLMGSQFTVADAYLFVVTNWGRVVKIDTR
jgi:glutathione S-transferase